MRILKALALMGVLVATGAARAQVSEPSLQQSSADMYNSCVANNVGAALECACMAGFYGGRLQADEYRLLSVLNAYIASDGSVPEMEAAQHALREEAAKLGMGDERFWQIMQRFASMTADGAYGDQICLGFRNPQ